jgi:hypothetical protein
MEKQPIKDDICLPFCLLIFLILSFEWKQRRNGLIGTLQIIGKYLNLKIEGKAAKILMMTFAYHSGS